MKAREAHQLSDEELEQRLRDAYQEQFNLRVQKATHELTNTARPGQVRKDIARIKTILRERELTRQVEAATGNTGQGGT
jgi:large subunit ribosomal protein L29